MADPRKAYAPQEASEEAEVEEQCRGDQELNQHHAHHHHQSEVSEIYLRRVTMLYLRSKPSDRGSLDLLDEVTLDHLRENTGFDKDDLRIKDTEYVASFNWLDSSPSAIMVPG